jgi:RimJ/RimL family protein N-acetyltransferase
VIRRLTETDRPALDELLARHAASTMFLRSNLRASGLVSGDGPFHGVYAGRFEGAALTDVAAHYWNGNFILFAPNAAADLVKYLAAHAQKPAAGFLGPWAQCNAALDALNLRHRAREPHEEDLFSLDLVRLNAPQIKNIIHRRAEIRDLETLVSWRTAYEIETLAAAPGAATEARAREDISRGLVQKNFWVAVENENLVAMAAVNARLPDMIQIGGVFTPKELRGRGHARIAVAGALIDSHAEGAATAILFTEVRNAPAKKVYAALGFARVGDYGLILLS